MKKALISLSISMSLLVALPVVAFSVPGSDGEIEVENEDGSISIKNSATSSDRGRDDKDEDEDEDDDDSSKGFEGSEVRGMDDDEKSEFLQTVKTHAELRSGQDLDNFAKGVLLKDEDVDSVEVDEEEVHVSYKAPAKFLGIFKTHLKTEGSVAWSATSTDRVKVKYPWYSFLFGLTSSSTPEQIEAAIESEIEVSSSSEAWMNKNAKGGLYIDLMVKIFSKWLAK